MSSRSHNTSHPGFGARTERTWRTMEEGRIGETCLTSEVGGGKRTVTAEQGPVSSRAT
jgi:hypothetical protein